MLFREMFSDRKVEQNFATSEDKLRYREELSVVQHHILKVFYKKDIESSECFVVSFDV